MGIAIFLQYINETGGTNYTWGELFKELFKPGKELMALVERKKREINRSYISVVFRFQNLLNDFKEYSYSAMDNQKSCDELISKCINGLTELQKKHPDTPFLVTSDSSTFTERVSVLPGIFIVGGKRVHIGCVADANDDIYLNSFADFCMLADSLRIYCMGTAEMYPTKFPMYAAKVNDVPFERILLE